jgi:hypothetical protein
LGLPLLRRDSHVVDPGSCGPIARITSVMRQSSHVLAHGEGLTHRSKETP